MATNNKPANQPRCGNIKATIWENTSEKGARISSGRGAIALRSGSMILRPYSPSHVKPRSGSPLVP
jgi:hypothetical protein